MPPQTSSEDVARSEELQGTDASSSAASEDAHPGAAVTAPVLSAGNGNVALDDHAAHAVAAPAKPQEACQDIILARGFAGKRPRSKRKPRCASSVAASFQACFGMPAACAEAVQLPQPVDLLQSQLPGPTLLPHPLPPAAAMASAGQVPPTPATEPPGHFSLAHAAGRFLSQHQSALDHQMAPAPPHWPAQGEATITAHLQHQQQPHAHGTSAHLAQQSLHSHLLAQAAQANLLSQFQQPQQQEQQLSQYHHQSQHQHQSLQHSLHPTVHQLEQQNHHAAQFWLGHCSVDGTGSHSSTALHQSRHMQHALAAQLLAVQQQSIEAQQLQQQQELQQQQMLQSQQQWDLLVCCLQQHPAVHSQPHFWSALHQVRTSPHAEPGNVAIVQKVLASLPHAGLGLLQQALLHPPVPAPERSQHEQPAPQLHSQQPARDWLQQLYVQHTGQPVPQAQHPHLEHQQPAHQPGDLQHQSLQAHWPSAAPPAHQQIGQQSAGHIWQQPNAAQCQVSSWPGAAPAALPSAPVAHQPAVLAGQQSAEPSSRHGQAARAGSAQPDADVLQQLQAAIAQWPLEHQQAAVHILQVHGPAALIAVLQQSQSQQHASALQQAAAQLAGGALAHSAPAAAEPAAAPAGTLAHFVPLSGEAAQPAQVAAPGASAPTCPVQDASALMPKHETTPGVATHAGTQADAEGSAAQPACRASTPPLAQPPTHTDCPEVGQGMARRVDSADSKSGGSGDGNQACASSHDGVTAKRKPLSASEPVPADAAAVQSTADTCSGALDQRCLAVVPAKLACHSADEVPPSKIQLAGNDGGNSHDSHETALLVGMQRVCRDA